MSYTGSVPDTRRTPDWREAAACATPQYARHHDLWFAHPGDTQGITAAKRVCADCPVTRSCLAYALDAHPSDGIFGGLTAHERKALKRRKTRGKRTRPRPAKTRQPAPKTLAEAFTRRTTRTDDGHLHWYGSQTMKFQGDKYTALQAAFIVSHGRTPEGPVLRACGHNCYRGDHLTDGRIRNSAARCGTRSGYRLHLKNGEEPCGPCRQANTDADNRLRRTGTTKVLAS